MAALGRRIALCLRREEGAQLIEFVIVFPILMLVIAGILDFGMMMRNYEVVTNAAREGARVAVLSGYGQADVEARVQAYVDAAGLNGAPPVVALNDVPIVTPSGTFTGRSVTVNYTYELAVLSGVSALFGDAIDDVALQSTAVMRNEVQAVAP
jgi:Flp pilus assembly protein TadG